MPETDKMLESLLCLCCRTFLLEVLYFFLATLASISVWKTKPTGTVGWFEAALIAQLHVTIGVRISTRKSVELIRTGSCLDGRARGKQMHAAMLIRPIGRFWCLERQLFGQGQAAIDGNRSN